jgi:hypothetical protein
MQGSTNSPKASMFLPKEPTRMAVRLSFRWDKTEGTPQPFPRPIALTLFRKNGTTQKKTGL